jgi:aspartate aminotransferase
MALSQSFAKNFGLYGERVGCYSLITSDEATMKKVQSRVKGIARPMYSNPPIHGARIVDIVLSDPELTKSWHQDLKTMSGRIMEMRSGLVKGLKDAGSVHDWSHITNQIGMFAYTGLTTE